MSCEEAIWSGMHDDVTGDQSWELFPPPVLCGSFASHRSLAKGVRGPPPSAGGAASGAACSHAHPDTLNDLKDGWERKRDSSEGSQRVDPAGDPASPLPRAPDTRPTADADEMFANEELR